MERNIYYIVNTKISSQNGIISSQNGRGENYKYENIILWLLIFIK